jgi:hypothetical protein
MFKFMQSPAYWWPAEFTVPAEDDPGKKVTVKFDAQFKRETEAEQKARIEKTRAEGQSDAEYVRPLITGFRKLPGVDGSDVPFSAVALDELLGIPGAGSALTKAYFESNGEAAAKN